jgi:hypothetical protein
MAEARLFLSDRNHCVKEHDVSMITAVAGAVCHDPSFSNVAIKALSPMPVLQSRCSAQPEAEFMM